MWYIARAHMRTCRCAPFPYLANDWTDCAEIWYAVIDALARHFKEVDDGVQLHVRTCALLFCISRTAGWIALKFDAWLRDRSNVFYRYYE